MNLFEFIPRNSNTSFPTRKYINGNDGNIKWKKTIIFAFFILPFEKSIFTIESYPTSLNGWSIRCIIVHPIDG